MRESATIPILELKNISVCYQSAHEERPVLHGISLSVDRDSRIGLYAPNGSGKTTLLRAITGLVPVQTGQILFHEKEMTKEQDFIQLRRSVGFVVQNAHDQIFFPTVFEDVAFGPLNLGMSQKDARQRACDTLERLGIADLKDRNTQELSGGELRLVALAGIMAMQPEILLLDEPTTGLDESASKRLRYILQNMTLPRITVSHDLFFLQQISDSFYTIQKKKLQRIDKPVLHTHQHTHILGDTVHTHLENI